MDRYYYDTYFVILENKEPDRYDPEDYPYKYSMTFYSEFGYHVRAASGTIFSKTRKTRDSIERLMRKAMNNDGYAEGKNCFAEFGCWRSDCFYDFDFKGTRIDRMHGEQLAKAFYKLEKDHNDAALRAITAAQRRYG